MLTQDGNSEAQRPGVLLSLIWGMLPPFPSILVPDLSLEGWGAGGLGKQLLCPDRRALLTAHLHP